jgi:hypothetical protein
MRIILGFTAPHTSLELNIDENTRHLDPASSGFYKRQKQSIIERTGGYCNELSATAVACPQDIYRTPGTVLAHNQGAQMMTGWIEFAQQAPELASFGEARFRSGVAYLGTLRPDGGPRVHPVTPIMGQHLFLFMEPTSPKGKDLQRDARYTLHCSVADSEGGEGEFYVRGQAFLTADPLLRAQAIQAASYEPQERYILFKLTVEFAFMNNYGGENPGPRRWQAPK